MRRLLAVSAGLVLAAFVYSRIDLRAALGLLAAVDGVFLGAAVLAHLAVSLVKAERWRALLSGLRVELPFCALLRAHLGAVYLGAALPAYAGDAARVLFVTRRGHPARSALAAQLLDRMLDLLVLLAIGALAVSSPGRLARLARLPEPVVGAAAVLALALALWLLRRRLAAFGTLVLGGLSRSAPRALPATLAQLPLLVAVNVALLAAIGVRTDYHGFLLCVAASLGVSAVPISVSGIGTREASMILAFRAIGLEAERAVAYSMLELVFIHAVGGGLAALALLLPRGAGE